MLCINGDKIRYYVTVEQTKIVKIYKKAFINKLRKLLYYE